MNRQRLLLWLARHSACPEGRAWLLISGHDPETAWAVCERGDWLIWVAVAAGVDDKQILLALCECVKGMTGYQSCAPLQRLVAACEGWAQDLIPTEKALQATEEEAVTAGEHVEATGDELAAAIALSQVLVAADGHLRSPQIAHGMQAMLVLGGIQLLAVLGEPETLRAEMVPAWQEAMKRAADVVRRHVDCQAVRRAMLAGVV